MLNCSFSELQICHLYGRTYEYIASDDSIDKCNKIFGFIASVSPEYKALFIYLYHTLHVRPIVGMERVPSVLLTHLLRSLEFVKRTLLPDINIERIRVYEAMKKLG